MWSVPILLSTQYVADAARQPRMDALLMMFLTAAMVSLERATAEPSRRRLFLALAALAMGCAILTKGPIGMVLPGLTLTIFLAARRRLRELIAPGMVASFLGATIIGASWYIAAIAIGGRAFFEFQIVHGLLGRFLGAAAGIVGECQNPFYYYFPRLISGFLPWSLFYPPLAVIIRRERLSIPAPMMFALCWFLAILGFFTISAGKCLVYILPLFPALAAVTAWLMVDVDTRPWVVRKLCDWAAIATGVGAFVMVVAAIASAASGASVIVARHLHSSDRRILEILTTAISHASPFAIIWMLLSIIGGLLAMNPLRRYRLIDRPLGVATVALAGTFFWYGFLNPTVAEQVTLKSYAEVVDRAVPPGDPVTYLGMFDCDLAFYCDREIRFSNKFACAPMSHDEYFMVWEDRLATMTQSQRSCLTPLAQSAAVDRHGIRVLMVEKK